MPINWPSPDSSTEADTTIRKRKFAETAANMTSVEKHDTNTPCIKDASKMAVSQSHNGRDAKSITPKHVRIQSTPSTSSPDSLTDDDIDSSRNSPSPNPTPSDRSPTRNQNGCSSSTGSKKTRGPVPASSSSRNAAATASRVPSTSLKRKRRTAEEKKAEEEEKERKQKEKEQRKKEAEENKAKEEAEKQARLQEKNEKKAKIEAEKNARAQEREAKRAKKEEEAQKARVEKEKKERAQTKLNSFFIIPSAASYKKTPESNADGRGKADVKYEDDMESAARSAKKQATETAYEKLFLPFNVKKDVRMAENTFPLGDAAREARSRMLDQYLSARPQTFTLGRLAAETFGFGKDPAPRGRLHKPVRRTIERMQERSKKAQATGSLEDQEAIRRQMRAELAKVPVKYLCYREDVRPAYRGTVTEVPAAAGEGKMRKLARRPNARVMPVNYDYDSEAEWVDEEGEDLDLDDDDDEDIDDGEGVGDLIDDSEAVDLTRFAANGLEPESTGLCWEDSRFVGPEAKMRGYRMEFIFGDHLERNQSIDPFSTAYWPDPKTKTKTAERTAADGSSGTMTKAEKKAKNETASAGIPAGMAHSDVVKIKKAIKAHVEAAPRISKIGLIEYLKSSAVDGIKVKGKDISSRDLKEVVEMLVERKGKKSKDVVWTFRPGYD
ncbi:hypothetical protein SODALDRAFT_294115 [Sodiomyces alkalinus F11]|uniref:Chromatin assembly factor 1 subunit A dimerization domain-containing protein n=1 Tax=Sodiomyces alkalinus (strain CBS 110278 / VKM F-3762 / F11) TaxID=1314773 RepID=A0A3N2PX16_SODAK|nr:hypothetical protein SODALDRAFT_294115 [Sodiomyces alkalinus F11]ROT38956.1 hypothetical protein SODALDRAFT_294115 [Sodiomyces alkalinus F11]